jgi:hypothetical protein
MTPIKNTIEIARSQDDVFAYLDQLERHSEWQEQVVSSTRDTDGPTRIGTRATDMRKVPGGPKPFTYEVTAHDPPRLSAFRGVSGPIRAVGSVTVEPTGEGRSRVTLELDFEGHGFGKLIVPLVRRDARKRVPASQARLKERLESGS